MIRVGIKIKSWGAGFASGEHDWAWGWSFILELELEPGLDSELGLDSGPGLTLEARSGLDRRPEMFGDP